MYIPVNPTFQHIKEGLQGYELYAHVTVFDDLAA